MNPSSVPLSTKYWTQTMPEDDYHSNPAISSSDCKLMLSSPAHYKCKDMRVETDAMLFGSGLHKLVLEGQPAFQEKFNVVDGTRTAKLKADAAANGISLLTPNQGDMLMTMYAAIHNCEDAHKLLEQPGPTEISGFWKDSETGLQCKIRPDKLIPAAGVILDLKTFSLQSDYNLEEQFKKQFSKAIWNNRYDMQAAYYLDGANNVSQKDIYHTFAWIVITKEAPHLVGLWVANNDCLRFGRRDYRKCLNRFRDCFASGCWPLPEIGGIAEIGLPEWVLTNKQTEDVIYD